ncbi:MAG: NAD(P)-binding domain-containing protein [Anaerolineae bacterium]|nr:NAD(P)-binding domain-containing protein [Anaerolineae bacterium]
MTHNGSLASSPTEVLIIGAGPIGLELAVALKQASVNYIQVEAKQIGHTISWWPRNTNFFSTSERIAISGVPIQNNHQGRITGEDYLAYLRGIVEQFDLHINSYETVTAIERHDTYFSIQTETLTEPKTYTARNVVMAKGDMDMPNWLNIPGEDLPHVTHYFGDPHTYFRKRLLVVGGRNSAVEATLRCWRVGAEVAISYRQKTFSDRVKEHIRPDLLAQIELGTITYYPETIPIEITPQHVVLQPVCEGVPTQDEPIIHPTDFVLLATGYRADMDLYERAGVTLEGIRRIPRFNPDTMETDVPGLYLAGTTAAGMFQDSYRLFIENSHEHVVKIVKAITGRPPAKVGTIPARSYELSLEKFDTN